MDIFSKSIDSLINYIFIKYSYQNKKFLAKKIFKHFYQINKKDCLFLNVVLKYLNTTL